MNVMIATKPLTQRRGFMRTPELTLSQAADVLGQRRESIWRWARQGLIAARRVGVRGDYRIKSDELRRFAHQYGYDFDEEIAKKLAK